MSYFPKHFTYVLLNCVGGGPDSRLGIAGVKIGVELNFGRHQ